MSSDFSYLCACGNSLTTGKYVPFEAADKRDVLFTCDKCRRATLFDCRGPSPVKVDEWRRAAALIEEAERPPKDAHARLNLRTAPTSSEEQPPRSEDSQPQVSQRRDRLTDDICSAINRCSRENTSNTPDFILTDVVLACLSAFEQGVKARDKWYGISPYPGAETATRPPSDASSEFKVGDSVGPWTVEELTAMKCWADQARDYAGKTGVVKGFDSEYFQVEFPVGTLLAVSKKYMRHAPSKIEITDDEALAARLKKVEAERDALRNEVAAANEAYASLQDISAGFERRVAALTAEVSDLRTVVTNAVNERNNARAQFERETAADLMRRVVNVSVMKDGGYGVEYARAAKCVADARDLADIVFGPSANKHTSAPVEVGDPVRVLCPANNGQVGIVKDRWQEPSGAWLVSATLANGTPFTNTWTWWEKVEAAPARPQFKIGDTVRILESAKHAGVPERDIGQTAKITYIHETAEFPVSIYSPNLSRAWFVAFSHIEPAPTDPVPATPTQFKHGDRVGPWTKEELIALNFPTATATKYEGEIGHVYSVSKNSYGVMFSDGRTATIRPQCMRHAPSGPWAPANGDTVRIIASTFQPNQNSRALVGGVGAVSRIACFDGSVTARIAGCWFYRSDLVLLRTARNAT